MRTQSGFLFLSGLLSLGLLIAGAGCGDDDGTGGSGATGGGGAGPGGGGAGPGGGGAGPGGGGSGGGTSDLTCAAYCAAITANCAMENSQYADEASCLGSCQHLPMGTAADMAGNTLGCRTYHAGAAAADPATHCVHAGPGGAGVCGSNVESFCTIAQGACVGANEQWATAADCEADAANFPDTEPYDASDVAGDTLACRLYHLTVAATDDAAAATHCEHIVTQSATCQ